MPQASPDIFSLTTSSMGVTARHAEYAGAHSSHCDKVDGRRCFVGFVSAEMRKPDLVRRKKGAEAPFSFLPNWRHVRTRAMRDFRCHANTFAERWMRVNRFANID